MELDSRVTNFSIQKKTKEQEIKNADLQESDLDTAFQKFNPSTSPPMNDFMERLAARTLSYNKK